MILKLLLAAIVLTFAWSAIARYKKLAPSEKKGFLLRAALFGLIGILVIGAITGRVNWIGAAIAALIPLLRFGAGALFKVLPLWAQSGGSIPFKTDYLNVKIHVANGQVIGEVRKGKFAGRPIQSLSPEELDELANTCEAEDTKAFYLLRFLKQRSSNSQSPPPDFGDPEYEEALNILGLNGSPTKEDILKAHKRLIHKLHPDRGGSDFLAARVNQARDVLLKKLGGR